MTSQDTSGGQRPAHNSRVTSLVTNLTEDLSTCPKPPETRSLITHRQSSTTDRTSWICKKCEDSGYKTFKTPLNYNIRECDFCDCDEGERQAEFWQDVAKKQQAENLANLPIPSRYKQFSLEETLSFLEDKVAQAIRKYIEAGEIQKGKNSLYLYGEFGTKKTTLASAILMTWAIQGKQIEWWEVSELIEEIQSRYKTGNNYDLQKR